MNCKKCGSPLLPNEPYCQKCGEKVESVVNNEVQSTPVQSVVQPVQTPVNNATQPVQPTPAVASTPVNPVQTPVQPQATPVVQQPSVQPEVAQPVQQTTPVQPNVQVQPVQQPSVSGVVPPQQPSVQPVQNGIEQPKNNKMTIIIIVVLILLAVIAIGVYLVIDLNSSKKSAKSNTTPPTEVVSSSEEDDDTTTTDESDSDSSNNTISFGGYNFTLPSEEYTSWTKNEYTYVGSNVTSLYIAFIKINGSNLTIDDFIADAEAIKTKFGSSGYESGPINSTTFLMFYVDDYIAMFVNLPDGCVAQLSMWASDTNITEEDTVNFLTDLATMIESATSDGTGSFSTSSIDDVEFDSSILN